MSFGRAEEALLMSSQPHPTSTSCALQCFSSSPPDGPPLDPHTVDCHSTGIHGPRHRGRDAKTRTDRSPSQVVTALAPKVGKAYETVVLSSYEGRW